jgi:REP element-mobilizing transposase RayT
MAFGRPEPRQADRHRRLLRLAGYDYSQAGAYFVTVCTQDRACLFGEVTEDGAMCWSDAGQMVIAQWEAMSDRFPAVEIDTFVVMPNHLHGIIWICDSKPAHRSNALGATTRVAPTGVPNGGTVGAGLVPARPTAVPNGDTVGAGLVPARSNQDRRPTLGDVMGAFKSLTTVAYARGVKTSGWPGFRGRLWQRNYYEHIIRDDESLRPIRHYILNNPARWVFDRENPQAIRPGAAVERFP